MKQKIKELKEGFRKARDIARIDKEMEKLSKENPEEFSKAMLESVKESIKEADELAVREKLADVLPIVSVSWLARKYFQKTPHWFYQRLNGNIVNGRKASFSEAELKKLSLALNEIGDRLKKSAALI